jgi:hypothetical protein
MIDFIKTIPPLILAGTGFLIVLAAWLWYLMRREAGKLARELGALQAAWGGIEPLSRDERPSGLDRRKVSEVHSKCKGLERTARTCWYTVDEHLAKYTSPEEKEGWFITRRLRELLPDSLINSHYHVSAYSSFPAVLTALGLTLTFVAILLALAGVHYNEGTAAEPVTGMRGLINGLSGKFVSSIVALILSVAFTYLEKRTLRGLRRSYDGLIATGERLFPYLSETHILLDLQRFASKQTVSISHISSEVVDRLVNAFQSQVTPALAEGVSSGMAGKLQDEFRPTMDRMNGTLEQLHSAIVNLESQKQESITSELRGLLESLEKSLVQSLGDMGTQFHSALSGAATKEFGNVQGTLEATRQMLGEMNAQFASMQAAFVGIIQKAEVSTNNQLDTGQRQTEAMSRLMEGLMVRLQETADNNVTSIRTQLTMVVGDLAEKVGSLSQDLIIATQNAARESQASAQRVVQETGNWSEATARKLEALVNSIEVRAGEFQAAGATLLQVQQSLQQTIVENAQVLTRVAEAGHQIQVYSTALAGQGATLENLSKQQVQVTTQLKETATNIGTAFRLHDDFLKQYRQVFEHYEGVFKGLDTTLGSTLATIQKGMQLYTQSVEHNFQEIVNTANKMLPDIVKKLDAQTGEIAEQIEELSNVLGKGLERLNGRTR